MGTRSKVENWLSDWWLTKLSNLCRRSLRIIICLTFPAIPAIPFHLLTGNFWRIPDIHIIAGYLLGVFISFIFSIIWTREVRYIKELNEVNVELKKLSLRDHLTGLHNRRYAELQLEQLQTQAKRLKFTIDIAVIDLDDLKKINDTYGHDKGDELLKMAATRMRTVIRSGDILARIGGDEFWIIFIHTSTDHSQCEQRLRDAINDFTFTISISSTEIIDISTGASIGFSTSNGTDIEIAIREADESMYIEKESRKKADQRRKI